MGKRRNGETGKNQKLERGEEGNTESERRGGDDRDCIWCPAGD